MRTFDVRGLTPDGSAMVDRVVSLCTVLGPQVRAAELYKPAQFTDLNAAACWLPVASARLAETKIAHALSRFFYGRSEVCSVSLADHTQVIVFAAQVCSV